MARKRGRRTKPFKLKLKKDTLRSIAAIGLITLGGLVSISFSQQGPILTRIYQLSSHLFGWGLIGLPFILILGGLVTTKVKLEAAKPHVFLGALITWISLLTLTQAGEIGSQVFDSFSALITSPGTYLFFISGSLVGFIIFFETSLEDIVVFIKDTLKFLKKAGQKLPKPKASKILSQRQLKVKGMTREPAPESAEDSSKTTIKSGQDQAQEPSDLEDQVVRNQPSTDSDQQWQAPPLDLLEDTSRSQADRGDIKKNADIIEKTLESFGIEARVVEVNLGPAVTQYAIELAVGTKLSKVTNLQNDLALALSAPTGQIRIEAPIPGRNLVGIEVPNRSPEIVSLKHMLSSQLMKKDKSKLAVGLGLNVAGEPVVTDITKMPHVLIAGATGSGKSVCINSFISSILYRASPAEVKLILVDPKRVELTQYNGIPHLLTPVLIDPEKVVSSLKWALQEMERRYKLFSEVKVRNIAAYNQLSGFQAMPYIVVFIDELADIMLYNTSEVEDTITRLAQMSRAVGIHLILSTQRPSTDVITGLIKANIPCRIAFNVTSMVDSRVIIDSPGAEKLLGRGDMLYIPPDQAKPRRIQGTFVSDRETKNIIEFLRQHSEEPEYAEEVTKARSPQAPTTIEGEPLEDVDELFDDAVKLCLQHDKASASLFQRRLSIGYARAARILDQLQRAGIVTPPDGSKPRDVLIDSANEVLSNTEE